MLFWNERKDFIIAAADLFSNHYGVRTNGRRIRLSPERLKSDYVNHQDSGAVAAYDLDNQLAGYCLYRHFIVHEGSIGEITWIMQLVVHPNFRHQKLAQNLIRYATTSLTKLVGIVSSHPYALRALEKSFGKRISVDFICQNGQRILDTIPIPYLNGKELKVELLQVDVDFNVDHTEIVKILKNISDEDWILGVRILEEGCEFLGIVLL